MKIRSIHFDGEEMPAEITIKVTLSEAIFIGLMVGKMSPAEANEYMHDGGSQSEDIYETLTGKVFDAYWEDGIDGAKARHHS